MPTIFMVIKDNLKKNNNTKIQREALLVEHTVVMVTRETFYLSFLFLFFSYIRQQLLALSTFGECSAVGHMTHRQLKSSFLL